MDDLNGYRFTRGDEWVHPQGDVLVAGITDYGQIRIGDIVHVELPEPDDHHYEAGEEVCSLESLGTSREFHAPVAGTIAAINQKLLSRPELVNLDPYGNGWIVKIKPDAMDDVEQLMDVNEYESGLPEDEDE